MWLFAATTTLIAILWQVEIITFGCGSDRQPRRDFFYVGGEYTNLTVGVTHVSSPYTDLVACNFNRTVYDQSDLRRKTYTSEANSEIPNRIDPWCWTNFNKPSRDP